MPDPEKRMSNLKLDLGQYALMSANIAVGARGASLGAVDPENKRARSFYGLREDACPRCWVKDNECALLEVTARASESNEYTCDRCGFKEMLSPCEADTSQ